MVASGGKNTVVPNSAPLSFGWDGSHHPFASSLALALDQKPGGNQPHPWSRQCDFSHLQMIPLLPLSATG